MIYLACIPVKMEIKPVCGLLYCAKSCRNTVTEKMHKIASIVEKDMCTTVA